MKVGKKSRCRENCAYEKSMERNGKSDEKFRRKDGKLQINSFRTLFEGREHLT